MKITICCLSAIDANRLHIPIFQMEAENRCKDFHTIGLAVQMREEGIHGIPVSDYTDENVSSKMVGIIQSYVGIADRFVWRKTK